MESFFNQSIENVVKELKSDVDNGLTKEEADKLE